jgi:hypothetical protein
MQCVDG